MKYLWFLTKEGRNYLFEPRQDRDIAWWRVVLCRLRSHPVGIVYYNPSGLEPNYTCRGCGDYLN